MVRRRRQKEQNARDQDALLSTSDTEVELVQLKKVPKTTNYTTANISKVINTPISSQSSAPSTITTTTSDNINEPAHHHQSTCQMFTIVTHDPELRNVCVEGDLLNLYSESDSNCVATASVDSSNSSSGDSKSSSNSESRNIRAVVDQSLASVNNQHEPQINAQLEDNRKTPRFIHSDRTDILNFILEENEIIKQKSQLLNGWFKKAISNAKRSVLGRMAGEQSEQSEDEEDDRLETQDFSRKSNSGAHELKLLVGSGDVSQKHRKYESGGNFLSNWVASVRSFGRQSNRSFLMSNYEEDDGGEDEVFYEPNKVRTKRSDQTRSYADCDLGQERMFMQLDQPDGFSSGSDDNDGLLLMGSNKGARRKGGNRRGGGNAGSFFKSKAFISSNFDNDLNDFNVKIKRHDQYGESKLSILAQVIIPFFIAGFGTVGAGLVLDNVQHWEVFQKISEVFILVPALLGLKGNLEMTLASRLSTQANLGNLDTFASQWQMATGNLALIQCQSTVVGFLAALFAIAVNWLPRADFHLEHALILCASSLLTACIASLLLGIVMIVVVIITYKCHINPDNVATPIAASLGDLVTLAILAKISSYLYACLDGFKWVYPLAIAVPLITIPLWCVIAHRNPYTHDVLYSGWIPVISAMAISSIGGCILDYAVARFKGIAVFQPVINGVGGNLAAVQASRISTYLHQNYKLGQLSGSERQLCISPVSTFFSKTVHSDTAQVLMLLVIPGHLLFTYGIQLLQDDQGHTSMTGTFLLFYLTAACIQVFILLYLAQILIFYMWRWKIDPDNSSIPYLTAFGDMIGTGLLAVAFYILFIIGDGDSDVGE